MFQYFDKIKQMLEIVETHEAENIKKAANLLADATAQNHSIFIFGASHAGILAEEMYYRAGGLMNINAIFGKEVMLDVSPITLTSKMERLEGYGDVLAASQPFREGDVLILHSVSGRNAVTIDMAMYAKQKGINIIVLTNRAYSESVSSRHSSDLHLYELADLVLDNHGEVGDGTCSLAGLEQKVGPSSTVIGATILNTIVVEAAQLLLEKGIKHPPIFYSANLDGGDELNRVLFEKYKEVIHYEL